MTPHPIDTMPADIAEEAARPALLPRARRLAYGGLLRAAVGGQYPKEELLLDPARPGIP